MQNNLTLTYPINKENSTTIPNVHIFKVVYLGATNNLPARYRIISERFTDKGGAKTFSYRGEWNFNSSIEYAINELIEAGFNILAKAEGKNCSYIISDTFREPFTKPAKVVKEKRVQYLLPSRLAPYLINGDNSGYEDSDIQEIDEFIKAHNLGGCIGCDGLEDIEPWFTHSNDMNNLGDNVYNFTFIQK